MRMLLLAGKHGQCLYFEQKTVGERSEGFYREIPDVTAALWRKSEYESVGRTKRETSLSSSATMNQFVHICLYQLTVPFGQGYVWFSLPHPAGLNILQSLIPK